MGWARIGARHWLGNHGLRNCIVTCAAIAAVLSISSNAADARHHRRWHPALHEHGAYSPPTASIVVDGNTGAVLEASNPDALRHPASLTKVMTLYLLFEQLDAGRINLDTRLYVTAHAAEQAPTKLGLKPGQTIAVEDAIKGIVTRSANDAAVVIAENLGGSEGAFAKIMTEKAAALGMTHTTYVNASGLPDDEQITTARDEALLGRAIQERFPRYYRFFSTTSFVFRGQVIRGHNHLLSEVAGVDGIKTGYTNASGFNLLTSIHHDGRYLVAAVLGGRSAAERDAHMRALIAANIELASTRRTAPLLALRSPSRGVPQRVASARTLATKPVGPNAAAAPATGASVGSNAPIRPVVVKTLTYRTAAAPPRMAPMPALVPAPPPNTRAAAPAPEPAPRVVEGSMMGAAEPGPAPAPAPVSSRADVVRVLPGTDVAAAEPANTGEQPISAAAPHSGWMIQIGAFDGEQAAREHLDQAKLKMPALASADPFTEPVQRGDTTLYRARFSGLDKETAEAACRRLRRSDIPCMALKPSAMAAK